VLAASAAIAATILTVLSLMPQMLRLRRTGAAEGVSPTWAGFGVVTNIAWFAYLTHEALWVSVPAPVLMAIFYGITFSAVRRAGQPQQPARLASATWAVVLAAGAAAGGWSLLGVLLGLSYIVQVTPAVWTAYTTPRPRGVAPLTWLIVLAEAVLWGYYGWWYRDTALLLFAATAVLASALMIIRYAATRHRWAGEPLPA
jgi:uncharacterized protein with PQ loop repeat